MHTSIPKILMKVDKWPSYFVNVIADLWNITFASADREVKSPSSQIFPHVLL